MYLLQNRESNKYNRVNKFLCDTETDATVRSCRLVSGNSPHRPGCCTTQSAMAKSRRTYAQPDRLGSRPLKLSQRVPKADLMPKCVCTNIARHANRHCTFPLYLCQPVTFSWPTIASRRRCCKSMASSTNRATPVHMQNLPSRIPFISLAPFSREKKVWIYISVPWPCVIAHLEGKRERLADGVCALWMEPGYVICPVMMWPHANLRTHMDRKMFGPAWPSYPSANSFSLAASLVFIANATPYDLLP